jgi:hypothetical protein
MSNEPVEVKAPEVKPTARLTVNKEQAMDLKIGLAVRMEVAGEVKEISKCYNDNEKYDVVLEDPIVKNVSSDEESIDHKDEENFANVSLSDLKKLISKENKD